MTDINESDRALVRGLLYELDGLEDADDRLTLVRAVLLANDLHPESDVLFVRGEDGELRLDTLPGADEDAEAALQRTREMLGYAASIEGDELELALDGSIRRRADLPLRRRVRDRIVGAWDRLTGGASR